MAAQVATIADEANAKYIDNSPCDILPYPSATFEGTDTVDLEFNFLFSAENKVENNPTDYGGDKNY